MISSKEGKEELVRVESSSISELGHFETSKVGNSDAHSSVFLIKIDFKTFYAYPGKFHSGITVINDP